MEVTHHCRAEIGWSTRSGFQPYNTLTVWCWESYSRMISIQHGYMEVQFGYMLSHLENRSMDIWEKKNHSRGFQVAKVLLTFIDLHVYTWCFVSISSPGNGLKRATQEHNFPLLFWAQGLLVGNGALLYLRILPQSFSPREININLRDHTWFLYKEASLRT